MYFFNDMSPTPILPREIDKRETKFHKWQLLKQSKLLYGVKQKLIDCRYYVDIEIHTAAIYKFQPKGQ